MKNTIFKKIKPLHSKNNSKYYKNNDNYNKNKNKLNDSDNNNNAHINNIIYDSNNNDSDFINVNKFMSIEKASHNHSNNICIFDKRKTFKNNLNFSNETNRNKKEYIYIKKEKELFERISDISPKRINKKELEINKNESNGHYNYTTKKIINKKINKENLISIKKYTNNDLKKNIISSVIKEKEEKNKIIVNSKNNLKNLNRSNEDNEESVSLNEVKTIKDESFDLESSFSTEKIDIVDKNINKNKKKENEMAEEEIFIKEPNTENNIKNKYKQKNLKIKNNYKKINRKKKRNTNLGSITNDKAKKIDEEEEKTIIYKNDNTNNLSGIKIMNYFKELIKKNNENNENSKEIKRSDKTNKLYNNLSDNILNSEKKNEHMDFFKRSNQLIKLEENSKNKELSDIIKRNIAEKEKEKKKNKTNIMLNNISKEKLKFIKEELLKKRKKKENNRYDNIEENENVNVSNNSINKKLFIKNEENNDNNKMGRKETKNSIDFTVKKKGDLKNINPKNFSTSSKNNNILFISSGTNNSEDKKINNINSQNDNKKKINRLKSNEIINKNETNDKNLTNKINSYNNYIDFKYTTKKNKTYFISNDSNKIFNNSSNDIYINNNNNSNSGQIKGNNNIKKFKKNQNIKIINNNNSNSITNGGGYVYIKNESSSVRNNRSNNYLKRSISPHLSKVPFYSKISNKLVLINKKSKKNNNINNNNNNRKLNLNIKINNSDPHKQFFRIEDIKNNNHNNSNINSNSNSIINSLNNINYRYSNNIRSINNNNTVINFYLNEILIDLSKSTKNKSNYLFNKINNNCYTYTKGDKHISPSNNYFKRKKMFSSFCSKGNKNQNPNPNPNSIYSDNKSSTVVLNDKNKIKNKNVYKKSKIKINVENIINSEFNSSIYVNKFKTNKEMNKNKKMNNINRNKKKENESFIDIQIPLVPEENIQVISLKTMKYNQCIKNSQFFFFRLEKIFRNEKLMGMILVYLTNKDLFNLSLVNNSCFKITSKSILKKIMNKIIYNINNKKLIEKIWNIELLKYSNFNHINNFDNAYLSYLNKSKKYDCDINKDLLRTFPHDDSFHKGSESYNKLFNVLRAYSNYNNEIGYAQGMNFIVAKLIVFFKKEKEAFIYLDSLFNNLEMVNVVGVNNNLEKKMKILQFLLKKFCPDVIAFMEKKKINHEIFTASWFITLFSKNFKYDNILLILWNFSIIFGWKFIFLFSISVIIVFKEKYIKLDLYDFTQYMKNIFVFENFKNKFKDIMNLTFFYLSKWNNIKKEIEKEFLKKKNNEVDFKSFNKNSEVEDDETNYIFP